MSFRPRIEGKFPKFISLSRIMPSSFLWDFFSSLNLVFEFYPFFMITPYCVDSYRPFFTFDVYMVTMYSYWNEHLRIYILGIPTDTYFVALNLIRVELVWSLQFEGMEWAFIPIAISFLDSLIFFNVCSSFGLIVIVKCKFNNNL